jgi:hypothetical protein
MRRVWIIGILLAASALQACVPAYPPPSGTMTLTSPAFANYKEIPKQYTCDGKNIHPPLAISGVPEKAQSLVLILDDPQAVNGTFVHWVVWNIPADTKELKAGELPRQAQQGKNTGGTYAYLGPCPPFGTHHYRFLLYATDTQFQFQESPTRAQLEEMMRGHVLDQAFLIGLSSHT